jgi:HPt (histidine-containing phosphotransfer) domain-containing protein
MEENGEVRKGAKISIKVDPEIEDLIPGFLDNRIHDVETMKKALAEEDYETIRVLGHRMKGNGAGYGFEAITTIGQSLEQSAKEEDPDEILRWIDELSTYLERIEVVYE